MSAIRAAGRDDPHDPVHAATRTASDCLDRCCAGYHCGRSNGVHRTYPDVCRRLDGIGVGFDRRRCSEMARNGWRMTSSVCRGQTEKQITTCKGVERSHKKSCMTASDCHQQMDAICVPHWLASFAMCESNRGFACSMTAERAKAPYATFLDRRFWNGVLSTIVQRLKKSHSSCNRIARWTDLSNERCSTIAPATSLSHHSVGV